ncbi:MAG: NADH:ubiquinone reductase (Na(+)-transporting) subunit C [Gammaproteobacteria bacterium]|nr:NADH:ubiquinone reductase (Na(+)-transporting) subunit C [Gammaproteobacteria bacterium]
MNNDSPLKAALVAVGVAFVCSVMVSTTRVLLVPSDAGAVDIAKARHVLVAGGLSPSAGSYDDNEVLVRFRELRPVLVDLETGIEVDAPDAASYDQRAAAIDPEQSVAIPKDRDLAQLGRRAKYALAYLLPPHNGSGGVVLPVHGKGMWSTIYGYVGLGPDLNTIHGVSFYEQAETPGVGDRFLEPTWLASWRGKSIYGEDGTLRFEVALPQAGGSPAGHRVDAISGATVTSERIGAMIGYWLGPDCFGPYLERLRDRGSRP